GRFDHHVFWSCVQAALVSYSWLRSPRSRSASAIVGFQVGIALSAYLALSKHRRTPKDEERALYEHRHTPKDERALSKEGALYDRGCDSFNSAIAAMAVFVAFLRHQF